MFVAPALAQVESHAPTPSQKPPKEKSPTHDAAVAILVKADAAIKQVQGVRYHGVVTAGGVRAEHFPKIEGTAAFYGDWRRKGSSTFFFDVTIQPTDGGSSRRLTTGGNGELYFLIELGEQDCL